MRVPEVEYAVAKVGRADTSTDPSPLNMTETIVHLKPRDQWRPGLTLEQLRAELGQAAELPGVTNIWTMPIINRIDMLATGVRSEIGVKVYGSDLTMLDETAGRIAAVLRTVRGAANVYPEPLTSAQYLNVRVDRDRAARYGLSVAAVQEVIENGDRRAHRHAHARRTTPLSCPGALCGGVPRRGAGARQRPDCDAVRGTGAAGAGRATSNRRAGRR